MVSVICLTVGTTFLLWDKGNNPLIPLNPGDTTEKPKDWEDITPGEKILFTVKWVDENGKVLEIDERVKKDEMPNYTGEMPGAYADENYIYSAPRWKPELAPVTSDVTYTLTFDTRINNLKYEWDMETDGWAVTGFKSRDHELDEKAVISETYVGNVGSGFGLVTDSVTAIKANAFKVIDGKEPNTQLTSVTIPNSVKVIGESAFENCNYLSSVQLDSKNSQLERIESRAFNKIGISTFDMPDSVYVMGDYAFAGSALVTITLPKMVFVISYSSFKDCKRLKTVKMLSGVKTIETQAFSGCSELVKVEIAETVDRIDSRAFSECTKLTRMDLPETMKIMGASMFEGCTNLSTLILPKIGPAIPAYFADNCESLINVSVLAVNTKIEHNAFANCYALNTLFLGYSVWLESSVFSCNRTYDIAALRIFASSRDKPSSGDYPTSWNSSWDFGRKGITISYTN